MARVVRKVRAVYCSKAAYVPRAKERGHEHQWSFSSRLSTVAPEGFPFSSLFRFSDLGVRGACTLFNVILCSETFYDALGSSYILTGTRFGGKDLRLTAPRHGTGRSNRLSRVQRSRFMTACSDSR